MTYNELEECYLIALQLSNSTLQAHHMSFIQIIIIFNRRNINVSWKTITFKQSISKYNITVFLTY